MRSIKMFLAAICVSALSLTACVDLGHPEINITIESDYSGIIGAINDASRSLSEKLSLIESAIKEGQADAEAQQEMLREAIAAIPGSLEEKLAAIESAISSQTSGLETKLALIEAAVTTGFANQQIAFDLLTTALETSITATNANMVNALAEIKTAINKISSALTVNVADLLEDIIQAIADQPDYTAALEAIRDMIEQIGTVPTPPAPGAEYVEMGHGLKWGTMNVGATKPEEYGDFFAWGEIEPKTPGTPYNWETYKWMRDDGADWDYITKYTYEDNQTNAIWYQWTENWVYEFIGDHFTSFADCDYKDDAARANWGSPWRTPTDEEWTILRSSDYEWVWTENYNDSGVNGMVVTSKVSGYEGNQIFLPAAGHHDGDDPAYRNRYAHYWSASIYTNGYSDLAYAVFFDNSEDRDKVRRDGEDRYFGGSIRPVMN